MDKYFTILLFLLYFGKKDAAMVGIRDICMVAKQPHLHILFTPTYHLVIPRMALTLSF